MKTTRIFIVLTVLVCSGCNDVGTDPGPIPTSGRVAIDSRYVSGQASGFSFDQATIVKFPNSAGSLPDICVFVQINNPGEIVGVFCSRPDSLVPTFRLLQEFSSLDSAESYFESLGELPDTTYTDLALPMRLAQIWAVKTRRTRFSKILIRHTLAYLDSSGTGAPTPYGEATFDWVYQPNGTRAF